MSKEYSIGDVVHVQGKVFVVLSDKFTPQNCHHEYLALKNLVSFEEVLIKVEYIDRKTGYKVCE